MFWDIVIAAGVIWIVMSFFNFLQSIQIRNIYKELETAGTVAFGKDAGVFLTRVMLFAAVDENGVVREAKKMSLVPVLVISRVSPFPQLRGQTLAALSALDLDADKRTKIAVGNLLNNYEKAKSRPAKKKAGEII